MVKLEQLTKFFEELWPSFTADDWDRVGLSVGSLDQKISKILLSVDVTKSVLEEAKSLGCNLVLSHHPLLLRGVNEVSEQSLKGQLVSFAIKSDIAIFSAHTNADKAAIGTAAALANLFGLTATRQLDHESGHGLVGELSSPESLIQFATKIAKSLPSVAAGLKVAGDPEKLIYRVALSPGAGDADLGKAMEAGVDVFITSDLRHHPAQDFLETPGHQTALIDIAHWASESVFLMSVAKAITERFSDLEVVLSDVRTDPWDFAVMQ